jgi:hypothetical protein
MLSRASVLAILSFLLLGASAYGQSSASSSIVSEAPIVKSSVVLESSEQLDFTPREAAIVAGFDTGEVLSVVAAIIPPQRNSPDASLNSTWWFAAPVRIPVGAREVTWLARLVSPTGEVIFTELEDRGLVEVDGVPELRAEVIQVSKQVSAAGAELITLEREMTRLRGEAEAIGNFGRIIDAQEELDRVEGELSQLADQTVSVQQFLQKAQIFGATGAQPVREQQLTREIATIAEATQRAERGEFMRRASSEREARRMMEALEIARSDEGRQPDYAANLKAELSRLIAVREKLETQQVQ